MNRAVYKISLDIHRQGTQVNLQVKKGDTARRLVVGLVEDGAPYVVDEGCYGVFMAKKPDGNTLFNACTIENGQIVYDFTEQTVSAAGRMLCEVQLYGSDDLLITSPRIAMIVSGSLLDEGVVSESESTVLGEILEELESIRDEMDELGELEVTVSGSEAEGYDCDTQLPDILEAHSQGSSVECLCDGIILPLVKLDGARADFFGLALGTQKYIWVSFTERGFDVVHGESGNSGSDPATEVFYIVFDGREGDYGLHTPIADIRAAYEAGKELRCRVPVGSGVADIPLVHKTVDEDGVTLLFGGSSAYLKEDEGGRTVSALIGIRDGGVQYGAMLHPVVRDGKYIVNMTADSSGGYKADKTYDGVLAVHRDGVLPIECRITVGGISYVVPLCGLADGNLLYGGSAGRYTVAVFHSSDESMTVMTGMLATEGYVGEYTYSKAQIDTALGMYIQDVDTLIGGDG